MRILRLSFILATLLSATTTIAAETGKPAAKNAPGQEQTQANAVEVMEELAAVGIEQALEAIGKTGAFYPFALLRSDDQQVRMMGFEGDPAKAPDPDAFASNLYREIRKLIPNNPDIEAVAIYRLHKADKNGEQVPGVWCLVDHRDQPAVVVFQPLVPEKGAEGQFTLGELVYQPANDPLFPDGQTTSGPSLTPTD